MLEIKGISKTYQNHPALSNVFLRLDHGIYALLGPNGAGKSTLMNILCNQLQGDQGEVCYQGTSIKKLGNQYYRLLGYAPQQQGFYEEFSGKRFLTYMALLKDIDKKKVEQEVQRVAALVNLSDQLEKKCVAYSGGMKQRLLVAQALLGEPEILLLDEPTAGLDPKERVALRKVIQSLADTHTILIATHVVSDVESIAKEMIFLKQGKIVAKGELEELLRIYSCSSLEELYLSMFQEELAL